MKKIITLKAKKDNLRFSIQMVALGLSISFLLCTKTTIAQNKRPNVIFILADDIGYNTPGFDGNTSYSTPNLDAMAQQGMRFTQCHASPLCSPSRFMLLTGKYNFRNYPVWGIMDQGQKTIGNIFKDAGYKTACYGKWQLDGGDKSLHAFGFDTYCVHLPFQSGERGPVYKSPTIYQNGGYVPDSLTVNQYSEDILTDSLLNFIDSNKSVPFFVYYPMLLGHEPFCPTPDDAAFVTWDPTTPSPGDTSFYPSMIKYMDKKIGLIINKVKRLGIENNTVIIYAGDNGTPMTISEITNDDSSAAGGKGSTTESGTHVPLVVYWAGTVSAGTLNNDLIDFTDFLPTLAGIANIPVPDNYGPLDGVSFAPRLKNQAGTPRSWIFQHFEPHPENHSQLFRWAQTSTYKLYDTSSFSSKRLFYNIVADAKESNPIPISLLTPEESVIRQQLFDVIKSYVSQGIPLFSTPAVFDITDSTAILEDIIQINGGSTITASGCVWGTNPYPTLSTGNHISDGPSIGVLVRSINGLTADTTFYARGYATNHAGTSYSKVQSFRTLLLAPRATAATFVNKNSFMANWKASPRATNYRLDVSTVPTFATSIPSTLNEEFNQGITPPAGWTISNHIEADTLNFGASAPSLQFKTFSQPRVTTQTLTGVATRLSFWVMGLDTDTASALLVEGFDGIQWIAVERISNLPKNNSGVIKTYSHTSPSALPNNLIRFRFTFFKSAGTLLFDDVSINYTVSTPSFVTGYNNLKVNLITKLITGLAPGTNYYYRVRAQSSNNNSGNSNIIAVTTPVNLIAASSSVVPLNLLTRLDSRGLKVQAVPNPATIEFTLTIQSNSDESVEISVMDIYGKRLYHAAGSNNKKYTFGSMFASGMYLVQVRQGKNIQTLKLIKGKG